MEAFSVHGAPSEYMMQEGIFNQLESKLQERGIQHALLIHGEKSWKAAEPFVPALTEVVYERHQYGGECSLQEIESVAKLVEKRDLMQSSV